MRPLYLTNTLTRTKELFTPINPGHVGMYVCGPTVYGDAHLGHARPGVTYDVLFRLLKHLGYKVRYVRNITDVGHLEHDADEGEDKIAKKARLEELEPMEVVQTYTERYHEAMRALNVESPSIEPRASGHIIEQIEAIKKILAAGYAYISNGSVYFDVEKYNRDFHYGVLSGRSLDDTLEGTRNLDGQGDKKAPYDFALWKKAEPEHIMRWPSPWGEGFPGWHLECSVMGEKYLGHEFDIHGGGMDLMFPHHECEIAQNQASRGTQGVHYWVHNNMITINGQKMGKSLGNFITLPQLFAGDHPKLERAYSPMAVRFFILQAHYRSTLDFSNEALTAAEKGYRRLMQAARDLGASAAPAAADRAVSALKSVDADLTLSAPDSAPLSSRADHSSVISSGGPEGRSREISSLADSVWEALCDDLNTPVAIAKLFDAVKLVNGGGLTAADREALKELFSEVVFGVLGLRDENAGGGTDKAEKALSGAMDLVLESRRKAREAKDWAESDRIRDILASVGITVKDTKEGPVWNLE
ncbi:MAG: cysteine--tRNA ligase [Bacteroidales bacterium]|nr:cysteine--tRNA ligase [Bacteroidales bacterium]